VRGLRPWLIAAVLLSLPCGGLVAVGSTPDEAALLFSTEAVEAPAAIERGSWRFEPGKLEASAGKERGHGHWLPAQQPLWRDCVVRAEFTLERRYGLQLLLQGEIDGDSLSGYALDFSGTRVRLLRLDRDAVVPLTASTRLRDLSREKSLAATVFFLGDEIVVEVHGGRSLASFRVEDATYRGGRVGLRRVSRQAARGGITHLSVQRLTRPLVPPLPAARRYLILSAADVAAVDLASLDLSVVENAGARQVVQGSLNALPLLLQQGVRPLEVRVDTPLKYLDEDYLVARQRGLEKRATGFVVDASYKNPKMVEALLKGYQRRYPARTRLVRLATSHQGRPVWALAVSGDVATASMKPSLLIHGGIHGNEPLSTDLVFAALQALLEESEAEGHAAWLDHFVLWFVPQSNPDGAEAHLEVNHRMGRKNGRETDTLPGHGPQDGVDLNRNFPSFWGHLPDDAGSSSRPDHVWYRGAAAASEPESAGLVRLSESEVFVGALSYHTGNFTVLAPYTIPGVPNPAPNPAWLLAERTVAGIALGGEEMPVRDGIYPVDGTEQDYQRFAFGTIALTVEAAHHTPLRRSQRLEALAALSPLWRNFVAGLLAGPSLELQVVNEDGAPVVATIAVDGLSGGAGEVWRTRCRDGALTLFVGESGSYQVRARQGDLEVAAVVEVGGWTRQVLRLDGGQASQSCDALFGWEMAPQLEDPRPWMLSTHGAAQGSAGVQLLRAGGRAYSAAPPTPSAAHGCGCRHAAPVTFPPRSLSWLLMVSGLMWARRRVLS